MATDRSVRMLCALGGASSSRVLNLCSLSASRADNPNYLAAPLFVSPILNTSIILKHSLRENEQECFAAERSLATKVIVPFNTKDLSMGGHSLFVGQKNFHQAIMDVGNHQDEGKLRRDIEVLELLDKLPSLDPFLLRELLDRNGFKPDSSYFAINGADQERMADYSSAEIRKLTLMVTGKGSDVHDASTARMTKALLANEVNELLEPLRATLNLDASQFGEGIYSWRGFLYYKWGLQELWPQLIAVLKSMKGLRPRGNARTEEQHYLKNITDTIILGVKNSNRSVRRIIAIYDDAYAGLVEQKNPKQFREFLLTAPSLFAELGEKMGVMSHIVSFWQYRFPAGLYKAPDVEDLVIIFQDFAQSIGRTPE
jgi:hypothetical protein